MTSTVAKNARPAASKRSRTGKASKVSASAADRAANAWNVKRAPQKRGRKPPPPNETARDRFVRIGNARMSKAIRSIALIGNLASPTYAWTPEDLDKMHGALMDAIEKTFTRFEVRKRAEPPQFNLG